MGTWSSVSRNKGAGTIKWVPGILSLGINRQGLSIKWVPGVLSLGINRQGLSNGYQEFCL